MRVLKRAWITLSVLIHPFLCESQAQLPARYAVVIDELLPDPTPARNLPNVEFIELRNASDSAWDLYGWKLTDGSAVAFITQHYILQADSFVVVCPATATIAFSQYGAVIGVTNFPSLNNDEDVISLLSPIGTVIHAVGYQLQWFNNAVKSEGGWTLEMIDPKNPCEGKSNWKASIDDNGGTPGRKNSVDGQHPDQFPPALVRAYVRDNRTIVAVFDESLDSTQAAANNHFILGETALSPVKVTVQPPLFKEAELLFGLPLQPGKIYSLKVSGIKDCSNNDIGMMNNCSVGIPSAPDSFHFAINEILFNPKSEGVDYVELFNRSQDVIDASALFIANRNASGIVGSVVRISEPPFLIFPGDYIVVTTSNEKLKQQFVVKNPQWVFQVNTFPSFPDDKGTVLLLNAHGKIIDELQYDDDWHFALVSDKEGKALERIDPRKETQWRENWITAASEAGYGTPTQQNSQYKQPGNSIGGITISPRVFSPDNDGLDDICFIHYQMSQPNFVANIFIYDINGRLVRRIYQNVTLLQAGFLRWDGLGENRQRLPAGLYIIYAELFDLGGNVKKFKNAVTLASKF